jgi:hypothetical protein
MEPFEVNIASQWFTLLIRIISGNFAGIKFYFKI